MNIHSLSFPVRSYSQLFFSLSIFGEQLVAVFRGCLSDKVPSPLVVVGVAVAVVMMIQAVSLRSAGTLPAARQSSAPVQLDLARHWTADPPAEGRALCNNHRKHADGLQRGRYCNIVEVGGEANRKKYIGIISNSQDLKGEEADATKAQMKKTKTKMVLGEQCHLQHKRKVE